MLPGYCLDTANGLFRAIGSSTGMPILQGRGVADVPVVDRNNQSYNDPVHPSRSWHTGKKARVTIYHYGKKPTKCANINRKQSIVNVVTKILYGDGNDGYVHCKEQKKADCALLGPNQQIDIVNWWPGFTKQSI